jgi:hypothetical protein
MLMNDLLKNSEKYNYKNIKRVFLYISEEVVDLSENLFFLICNEGRMDLLTGLSRS